nr:succinylglutamate desuccinylase [Dongshaea marina]
MFLAGCGVRTILLSHEPTTTFSYFSSQTHGAHAFTVELGKARPFGQNDMSRFTEASSMLEQLVCEAEPGIESWQPEQLLIYQVNRTLIKHSDEFYFTFSDAVANFTEFPRGHLLAVDGSLEHRVELDFEAIVFPNARVAKGERTCLLVSLTQV